MEACTRRGCRRGSRRYRGTTILCLWVGLYLWAWYGVVVTAGSGGGGCPKVCECKWKDGKETVSCIEAGFIDVPRGLDPSTQVLDLRMNNLQILPKDSFLERGLLNLQKIWLTGCNIKRIERGAFHKLTNLVELDLTDNNLDSIPIDTLSDVPGLRVLLLAHNRVSTVPAGAFKRTSELVRLDLSDNRIQAMKEHAFDSLSRLKVLKLSANHLQTVMPKLLLPLTSLQGLHLDANPWHCDCHLRSLRRWMVDRNVASTVQPVCSSPQRLKDRSWHSLELNEFVCVPQVTAVAQRVLVHKGDDVSLACRVDTDTDASVTWLLGDRMLRNGTSSSGTERYRVSELVSPNHFARYSNLTIESAAPHDAGIYRCIAENKAGRGETNLTLKVSAKVKEKALVGLEKVFMTGGLLSGVAVFLCVMLIIAALLYQRRRRLRRHRSKLDILVSSGPSRGLASLVDPSSPKVTDYHIVPTSEMDEAANIEPQAERSWMQRDSSIDDFAPAKDLEKSSIFHQSDILKQRDSLDNRKKNQSRTVAYVEIPKYDQMESRGDSHMGSASDILYSRCGDPKKITDWSSGGSIGGHQRSASYSDTTAGMRQNYPDLLDHPRPPKQERQHRSLQSPNPSYCTLPRRTREPPKSLFPGPRDSPMERRPKSCYDQQAFAKGATTNYRSCSALNLDVGSGSPANMRRQRYLARRHPSLPTSPSESNDLSTLTKLYQRNRSEYLSGEHEGDIGGDDPYRYEYHAAQLEKFLQEYKTLQEQLQKMKESCESIQWSAPNTRDNYSATDHQNSATGHSSVSASQGVYSSPSSTSSPSQPQHPNVRAARTRA